jgi:polyferredoxin
MGIHIWVLHLANFIAPALGVAALLALWSWWLRPGQRLSDQAWRRARGLFGWVLGAGVLTLLAGLVVFGRDGKMATYAALVMATGSVAWWQHGR